RLLPRLFRHQPDRQRTGLVLPHARPGEAVRSAGIPHLHQDRGPTPGGTGHADAAEFPTPHGHADRQVPTLDPRRGAQQLMPTRPRLSHPIPTRVPHGRPASGRLRAAIALAIVACALLPAFTARALPRYSARYEQNCMLCHVNPSGGGMRSAYAVQELVPKEFAMSPATPEVMKEIDPKIGKH